jgi:putative PIN family toxin of toxin-antitoxin system
VRIVVDSNLLVLAFLQPNGLASQLMLTIIAKNHSLLLSNEIVLEVSRVLRYPRMINLHAASEKDVYNFVGWLRIVAEMIAFDPFVPAPIRDESDIFVLQTALSGGAEILCTCDRDFFEPPASIFLESRGIAVLTDAQLMRKLNA